ncbi:MAG: dihydrodipicolinate synthase family protein [Candidatus Omnitrophota bacterium]
MSTHKVHIQFPHSKRLRRPTEAVIAQVVRELFSDSRRPVLIAVGGPGGIGKSRFSRALKKELKEAAVLTLDDYKTPRVERARSGVFGADPRANKMDLIREHLRALRERRAVRKPVYDAVTGGADRDESFAPESFVILDGEISTYRQFRDLVDFAVFIDADWKTQLATRLDRDIQVRKYSHEKAVATFLQSNLREFSVHGAESKSWADLHLFCLDDYRLVIEAFHEDVFQRCRPFLDDGIHTLDLREGVIVPVLTPFQEDGSVDQQAFAEHLAFLSSAGIRRILVSGFSGEFFSLTYQERRLLLKLACEYFPGMILFHTGAEGLAQIEAEAHWADTYGADGIVVSVPYFLRSFSAEGLRAFFQSVGESVQHQLVVDDREGLIPDALYKKIPCHAVITRPASGFERRIVFSDDLECPGPGAGRISQLANAFPECFTSGSAGKGFVMDMADMPSRHAGNIEMISPLKQALSRRIAGYPSRVRLPLLDAAEEK